MPKVRYTGIGGDREVNLSNEEYESQIGGVSPGRPVDLNPLPRNDKPYFGYQGASFFDTPAVDIIGAVKNIALEWARQRFSMERIGPQAQPHGLRRFIMEPKTLENLQQGGEESMNLAMDITQPLGGVASQIKAFHGSPHKFKKFTTKKMGTGEGGQAFGWGLYFTDQKDIAKTYARSLSFNKGIIPDTIKKNLRKVDYLGFDTPGEAISAIRKHPDWKQRWDVEGSDTTKIEQYIDEGSHVYDITLHKGKTPDQYDYIDFYEAPKLSQMKKIFEQLDKRDITPSLRDQKSWRLMKEDVEKGFDPIYGKELPPDFPAFNEIQRDLTEVLGPMETSLTLRDAGIDGIRFPTETLMGSKPTTGRKEFNYVVFDENAITID